MSLLKTLLQMEGFDAVALEVDADVVAAVQREKPDILLLDVHLGQQSGMEIVEDIRKDPALANVRVVMTSGMNLKYECLRRGADYFLLKPFMPDDLVSALKK